MVRICLNLIANIFGIYPIKGITMNAILLQMIIMALSGANDWDRERFTEFCHDVEPLIDKVDINYHELCPFYDKYIHRLDKVDMVLKKIEK